MHKAASTVSPSSRNTGTNSTGRRKKQLLNVEIKGGELQMKGKRIGFFCGILILCLLVIVCVSSGFAEEVRNCPVSGKDYVLPENSNYDYSGTAPVDSFFYGVKSMGTLYINGALEKETIYNGYSAFGATGELLIRYAYSGAFNNTEAESWHVEADGTRWIRDYDLGFLNNIASGCIMIEKSPDGISWEKAIATIYISVYYITLLIQIAFSYQLPSAYSLIPNSEFRATIFPRSLPADHRECPMHP